MIGNLTMTLDINMEPAWAVHALDRTRHASHSADRAGLSETARMYISGLLMHASTVLALAAATTNSYRQLVPGYETPVKLIFSQRHCSAAPSSNLYLTCTHSQ